MADNLPSVFSPLNPFIPKFLNLNMSTVANRGVSQKPKNRMLNSVDPDKVARYQPSGSTL